MAMIVQECNCMYCSERVRLKWNGNESTKMKLYVLLLKKKSEIVRKCTVEWYYPESGLLLLD